MPILLFLPLVGQHSCDDALTKVITALSPVTEGGLIFWSFLRMKRRNSTLFDVNNAFEAFEMGVAGHDFAVLF
jgi:hypothetical protein